MIKSYYIKKRRLKGKVKKKEKGKRQYKSYYMLNFILISLSYAINN